MRALGQRSIASFIRLVLDAAWWLVAVSVVLLSGLLVCALFVNLEGDNLTMDLPIALVLNAPVHDNSASLQTDARIEKLRGNLRFPVRRGAFFSGSMLLVVVLFGFLLWGLTQLRHVFRSLSRGLLFIPENARRIRWVGFAVISGELARAAVVYFWSFYTSQHFTVNGLRFVASMDFNGITILSGLAILVIAEVFREGTRLHEEQSLTI
ncbi:DUF2975 domain-containing protein [uncultured Paludibaculum sp.]|uniref:DUF2975 domain-containing protein n=1 Tax=uncultured Paludibaculum sp. TaxID=1765020 RepID=UPI002AAB64A5|nr:DUF2975 domain-containing protein [uncultured Paludibaculum sp.]